VLRANAGWVLLATAACLAGAWFMTRAMTPSYLSQASVILESRVSANTTPVAPAMGTEKQIVNSGVILDSAARALGVSIEALKKQLDVSVPPDANILSVACHGTTPEEATRCARVVSGLYIDYRNGTGTASRTATPSVIKATLVTDASLPTKPESNQAPVILAAGLVLGLALGVGTAFLRDLMSPRLRGVEDFAARAGLPVLTVVPRVSRLRAGFRIERAAQTAPDSSATEAFRYLRTRLAGLMPSGLAGKVILVTSAVHGEGRSSVVANLATVVARSGLSVLVVDADSVRPAQHRIFGLDRSNGFAETVLDESLLDGLMQRTTVNDLRVLAAGTGTASVVDLLASSRLGELFGRLRAAADVVIVDAGPLLQVSDAAALAPHSDVVLLVADAKRSTRGELAVACRQLDDSGVLQVGVLNDMPAGWGERPAAGRERRRFAGRIVYSRRHDASTGGWRPNLPRPIRTPPAEIVRPSAQVSRSVATSTSAAPSGQRPDPSCDAARTAPIALAVASTSGSSVNGSSSSSGEHPALPSPVIPKAFARPPGNGTPKTASLPILADKVAGRNRTHEGADEGDREVG
jgi:capsular exopolysaccharide synthesis family protein